MPVQRAQGKWFLLQDKYTESPGVLINIITVKALSKIAADDNVIVSIIIYQTKIRLGIPCESSARQTIHMKCQFLFSPKNTRK